MNIPTLLSKGKLMNFAKENVKLLIIFFVGFILFDSVFIQRSSDLVIFSSLLLYIILLKLFHIKSRTTFLLCFVLLVVMAVSYAISFTSIPTEKTAVWLVLFFGIGIIQQWNE